MDKLYISEFAGRVSIKYGNYKVPPDTLEKLIAYAIDTGIIYPETVGKDRTESLIFEQ